MNYLQLSNIPKKTKLIFHTNNNYPNHGYQNYLHVFRINLPDHPAINNYPNYGYRINQPFHEK